MSHETDSSVDLRKHPNKPELKSEIIESRKKLLLTLGFSEDFVADLTNKRPVLYPKDAIQNKIKGLKERGFKDPVKMITTSPEVLNLGWENIDGKIKELKERGFKDPVKMITARPQVLGLGWENIDGKIKGLKERGFKDPVKMITARPQVLGLGWENIDGKLMMLKGLVSFYHLPFSATDLIENWPTFLSYKFDKIRTTARVITEGCKSPEEVSEKLIRNVLLINLECLILASREKTDMTMTEIMSEARKIKKQKLSREEKRARIAELPEKDKVRHSYFRGYPMKKRAA